MPKSGFDIPLALVASTFLFLGSFLTQYSYYLYFFFTLLPDGGSLRPSTRKVLSLAAKARTLQQDKEHLRINLTRAEEEVRRLMETIFLKDASFPGNNLMKHYLV